MKYMTDTIALLLIIGLLFLLMAATDSFRKNHAQALEDWFREVLSR